MQSLKSKRHHGKRFKKRLIVWGILIAIVGFLTWLGISAFVADINLELVNTYELPEFSDLSNLPEIPYGDMVVAIDGQPVTGNNLDTETLTVRPTASTIKMVLALAVMQMKPISVGERGEIITITPEMYGFYSFYASHNGSNTKVEVGKTLSEYDALASVLLASSNNMADSLAVWAFGSFDNYRTYAMNMLKDWGITNTTIGIDASGYDESSTSTAEDLAKIAKKLMENDVLSEIVGTQTYVVPMAGYLSNSNKLLGKSGIIGVKTGFIGDTSGYCLVTSYKESGHVVTVALMGAPNRDTSFNDSLAIVEKMQKLVAERQVLTAGDKVGYYDSWWTGKVNIIADEDFKMVGWRNMDVSHDLQMTGDTGVLKFRIGDATYDISVHAEEYKAEPDFSERILHAFGWQKEDKEQSSSNTEMIEANLEEVSSEGIPDDTDVKTSAESANCTIKLGALMLVNPNFTVEESFIATRGTELVSLSQKYGIREGVAGNGDNLLDAEAASHINDMIKAYETEYPGHELETRSCFRARGTQCGRLCAATGASDHHTGLTCDLIDPVYGTSLDTSTYPQHTDWQWLRANSYKYGFIDRFPEAWAGGSMDEPLNVDENGSTGLFETWHYRYVGVKAATEIASGKYNNGQYDSLEHYLKTQGLVTDLKAGKCE